MGQRNYQANYRYDGTTHTIAVVTASVEQTAAISEGVEIVRIMSTTDCFITYGSDAQPQVATTSDLFIQADQYEYFSVHEGEKFAAIRSSADGTLFISEMSQ